LELNFESLRLFCATRYPPTAVTKDVLKFAGDGAAMRLFRLERKKYAKTTAAVAATPATPAKLEEKEGWIRRENDFGDAVAEFTLDTAVDTCAQICYELNSRNIPCVYWTFESRAIPTDVEQTATGTDKSFFGPGVGILHNI
jgi:hypothetical protein